MMDFGYLGSSSNLSAQAPPFTLERIIPKPNAESFMHFTDPPPAVPFSSSLSSWQYPHSSASNLNCYPDSSADFGVDSIRTSYLASESYYPYFRAPSISSPTTQMPPLNANNVSTAPDAFVFPQYSGPIPTSYVEPKPYCHSFASPVIEDDVPLVVVPKHNYDLSSTSQIDYLKSLSGLKYTPHWGSYWDNIDSLADGEMGKQVDYDGSLCSTQIDGSYAYRPYPDPGASTVEGFGIRKESHPARLNFSGETQIVTPVTSEVNSKSFPTQGSSFTRYDPARSLGISMFPKSHANAPLVEAGATILNHQKSNESQDQSFLPLNGGKNEYITTIRASPPVVIRPPPVGFNLRLDKKEHNRDSFPSSKGDISNKPLAENVEGYLSRAGKELQLPDINGPPYSLTSASDHALDSPCWKGVSSFRFSSEDHEPETLEHIAKKPGPLPALKVQETQFCTPYNEDNAKIPSQKAVENGYVELGSLLCPDNLPNAGSPVKAEDSAHDNGDFYAKKSISNLDPFSNNTEKLTEGFDSSADSIICSVLKPVQWKKLDLENDIELGFGAAEAELDCNSVSSKLDVQKLAETIDNLSKLLLFQCSDDASVLSEVGQQSLKVAMKNLDACVSKMVPNPAKDSFLQKSVILGRPSLPKEASPCLGFYDHPPVLETKDSELPEKEVKYISDLFSAKVGEDFEKDNKVIQAIKNILEENFVAEEEMQPEAILYKNLWLEAEAALCSVSFRARYNRMKTKLDTHKSPKKIVEPVNTFEDLYNEVFPDPSSPRKGNPIVEDFKMFHKSNQDPSASRKAESVDEAETSFKERLDILNNRVSNQSSAYAGEQTDVEVDAAFAETIKTVEKLLSSVDADDYAMTKLAPKAPSHAIRSTIPSSSIYAPSPCTGKTFDNAEASVMARLQILKDRSAKAVSESSGEETKNAVSSETSGDRNPWRFNTVLYEDDLVNRQFSQDCKGSERDMVNDFDDLANQISGKKSLGTQISLGWGDGFLSDWEDVKDDFACQK